MYEMFEYICENSENHLSFDGLVLAHLIDLERRGLVAEEGAAWRSAA